MSLAAYAERFRRLNVNVAHGRASPHKICMLLAVLDLARGGALAHNRIEYAPPLLERYAMYFKAVRAGGDHPNRYFPFFHLAGRLRGGGEFLAPAAEARAGVGAGRHGFGEDAQAGDRQHRSCLDPELFELMQDATAVDALGAVLAEAWFGRGLQDLDAVVEQDPEINRYERALGRRAAPCSAWPRQRRATSVTRPSGGS